MSRSWFFMGFFKIHKKKRRPCCIYSLKSLITRKRWRRRYFHAQYKKKRRPRITAAAALLAVLSVLSADHIHLPSLFSELEEVRESHTSILPSESEAIANKHQAEAPDPADPPFGRSFGIQFDWKKGQVTVFKTEKDVQISKEPASGHRGKSTD